MKRTSAMGIALGLAAAGLALGAPSSALAKAYKGGELFSSQAYLHGRMEVRMRMARGSGILSTFFTYKDGSEIEGTFWEEIDIEVFGKDNATTWQSNIITGVGTRTTSEGEHTHPASLADDYHTYVLEWTPEYVMWKLDGVEVRKTTGGQVGDLTSPQSLRFNLWAANIESWVGPFDTGALPAYQFVNWIKFYRYEGGQFTLDWTDDFDAFDAARWGRADWTFNENLVDFDPNNVIVRDGTLILALTPEGQTGFTGTVPADSAGNGNETDDTGDTSEGEISTADTGADPSDDSDNGSNGTSLGGDTRAASDDSAATASTTSTSTTSNSSDPVTSAPTTGGSTSTNTTTTAGTSPSSSSTSAPGGTSSSETSSSSAGGPTQSVPGTTSDGGADEASGCACRLTAQPGGGQAASPLLGLALAYWIRRRRTRT
jgi:endo-1,3-1,4-beta-glycanase ExoK